MAQFIFGAIIGGIVGAFAMAMCAAAKEDN